jgi:hypothetical protein
MSIRLEELLELDDVYGLGSRMGWYAKGHHDPEEFLTVVLATEVAEEGGVPRCSVNDVRHVTWRTVPIAGVPGGRFVEGDGRGAWPATVIEWSSGWARAECQIVECHKAARPLQFPVRFPWTDQSLYLRVCRTHHAEYEAWHRHRVEEEVAKAKAGGAV